MLHDRSTPIAAQLLLRLSTAALLVLAGAPLAAQGSGTGPGAGEPRDTPLPDLGSTVAVLETRAPIATEFLLRGTMPVPRNMFPRADGRLPFAVRDFDGDLVVTQTEVVTRFPDASAGADVVELIARVHRDPGIAPGAMLSYQVVFAPRPPRPEDPLQDPEIPQTVRDLFQDPNGIVISAYDCFGNRYTSKPLDGTGQLDVVRRGPVQTELRVYQTMMPVAPVSGPNGTLPHFFGVHAYISMLRGAEVLGLDLRFSNGHDGNDQTTALDDPLDKVYFERIEVSLPARWTLHQQFEDPFFGDEHFASGRSLRDLVLPMAGGRMHVLRWQGQFHRRLMIAAREERASTEALGYLNCAGQAFTARGFDAGDEHEYWSWWNRATARYFPQRQQLPLLDHVGRDELEQELGNQHDFVAGHLEQGTGDGFYPVLSGALGWGHPYGVSYGGMTSGLEIYMYDGISVAAAASKRGYRMFEALHRMATDRMPTVLYRKDGTPSSVEEWLVENGNADYVPMDHFLTPMLFGSHPDPFGFHDAPRFQIDYVQQNGLAAGYEGAHFGFEPHDFQHFVRYTRSAKVLVWLGNDSLAKDDLRMQAENFHLTYHPYRSNAFGGIPSSGMLRNLEYVAQFPGKGFPFGRGEAWGLDCVEAAYSSADDAWRERKFPWLAQLTELLLDGQASCSGFIQAFVSDKAVDGLYQARQVIEQSITEHALVGLHESVFRRRDPAHAAMLRDILSHSLYAFIGEMSWFPGEFGPWRYTGVGPLDPHLPMWCSRAEMPVGAWTEGDIEAFQDWSSFGYGYALTGDTIFLRFARFQIGAPDFSELVRRLQADGTENLENRAALLAWVQRVDGRL